MPIWPFRKRPRNNTTSTTNTAMKDAPSASLSEKPPLPTDPRTTTSQSPPPSIPRRSSLRDLKNPRAPTPRDDTDEKPKTVAAEELGKENIPSSARRARSIEDITALPMSRQLQHSPHLRPVDLDQRPHIPYNFRQYSNSQTSIQRDEATALPSGPRTLRSRRSNYDNSSSTPQRRRSSRRGNNKTDHVREEEIRAMSSPISIPKRPGDGPLRRESKKVRSIGGAKDSTVSLPPEESVHTTMSNILEHRGWDIGSLDVFNPRPSVRLSGTPQYITAGSVPGTSYATSEAAGLKREKDKMPVSRDSARKRETIGNRADDLDASDLRLLLERDAKRRERRKKDQQEKLDRKLRSRNGRNRGDSDRKRRDAEEEEQRREDARRVEEKRRLEGERVEAAAATAAAAAAARQRFADEEETTRQRLMTPPTDVHPALRDTPTVEKQPDTVGLGIGEEEQAEQGAQRSEEEPRQPENPFTDDAVVAAPETEPEHSEPPAYMPGAFTPLETPLEDPVIATALEIRMSQTATPPLSPIRTSRLSPPLLAPSSSLNQALDQRRASDLPPLPPPVPLTDDRRASDPKPDRRAGAWATFFRRGGTTSRRQGGLEDDVKSATSFSNTSRESMRNQPIPAHLIDTGAAAYHSSPKPRSKSGTPVRTQSKFREDLPELPISPPDSRVASPDVTTAAAAAAAAAALSRRQPNRVAATPVDIPSTSNRATPEPSSAALPSTDTPISSSSPHRPGHGLMSASLASIGSEGSWLASGTGSNKRLSTQSGLRRSIGSLSKRPETFTASYEELGEDRDAEYFHRVTPSPDGSKRAAAAAPPPRGRSLSTALGPSTSSPDDVESEVGDPIDTEAPAAGENPTMPFTVHQSLRRHPTLVHRDPRLRSREGLLVQIPTSNPTGDDDDESAARPPTAQLSAVSATSGATESPIDFADEPELQSATSVTYAPQGHSRHVSAGSARLLDVRRSSAIEPRSPGFATAAAAVAAGSKVPDVPALPGADVETDKI